MKIVLSTFIIFFSILANANDVETVLRKMHSVYNTNDISFKSTYTLFKGHFETKVHSSYKGYVYKKGTNVYQKINNTEFVYGVNYSLKINNDEKAMVLSGAQNAVFTNVDLKQVMKECKSSKIVEENGAFLITFYMNPFSEIPCTFITVKIDKSNYTLLGLDLYFSSYEDFSEDYESRLLVQPHLRISFNDIKLKPSIDNSLFDFSSYLTDKKSMLTASGKYSGYTVLDYRNK